MKSTKSVQKGEGDYSEKDFMEEVSFEPGVEEKRDDRRRT